MAEAAAVVGLVASIASLVELTAKVVSRLHEFISKSSEVPESFRSLSTRLPLLTATLQHIQSQAEDGRFPDNMTKALKAVVDDTSKQVSDIQISLSNVLPLDSAPRLKRALKALKSLAKEDKIQRALEKINRNNDILVLHQTTRHVDTGDRILEALSKLSITPPTLPCPSSTIPFGRDPDFVNPGAIIEQLYRKCALPASRTALIGLGGVGKSQLAIELGYRTREQSPETWVLWIHAGNTARLEQSFREIADYIEIPGRQDPRANIFRIVYNWLRSGKSRRWLLILDNLDNPGLLSEVGDTSQRGQETGVNGERGQPITAYLPQSQNGSILVISRSKDVALKLVEDKDIIAVQPMAPVHALLLFEKKLGLLDQGDNTVELAAALEYIPLAIVQAAAYISQRAPRCSVRRYLDDYRKRDRKKTSLLNYEGGQLRRDWQAQNSIIVTWQISFEHIRQIRPSAADLLSLMSFFDRQGIPEVLLRSRTTDRYGHRNLKDIDKHKDEKGKEKEEEDNASESSENDGFEDDVQMLKNYSFLSFGRDQTFEMHALVQLAARKWLEAHGELEHWKQHYIKNLLTHFPSGEYENWSYCQALFPHAKSAVIQRPRADGSLKEWASLLYNAAWYALEKGSINEAVDMSEKVVEVRGNLLGQEHRETLSSLRMVGLAYGLGGRWKEAEQLEVQLSDRSQKVLGKDHPDTLASMANLASTYMNQGRWEEAEQLGVQTLETSRKVMGREHLITLNCMNNLASTYNKQGRWKEATQLQLQVIQMKQKILGKEHPDILMAINCLASTYWDQGRWEEAEQLQLQVIEIRQKILGEEHPGTLTAVGNLASTYYKQDRLEEAEQLQLQAIKTEQKVLGKGHPDTLISINNLALTYSGQGRWKEAEKLQLQVVETARKVVGEDHPDTLISIANLASKYWEQGCWEKAEQLKLQVVKKSQNALGKEHPFSLLVEANLASIYFEQGRSEEAELLSIRLMETSQKVLGKEHPFTLTVMANLAFIWKRQGRTIEAISLMLGCFQLQTQILGPKHSDTEASLKALYEWENEKTQT